MKTNQNLYEQYRGLVIVRDENYREIATLYIPSHASPIAVGPVLKRLMSGHFYFPTEYGANGDIVSDGAVWSNTMDFAAWLTAYLKFGGTRRQKLSNRTSYQTRRSVELLPTGTRVDGLDYIYTLRPQASRTKPGVHVHLSVTARRMTGAESVIFDHNLHAFVPAEVQGRGYSFIELGR